MQIFLIMSTCILYLVAAGIFSRAVWYFEANKWAVTIGGDALGSGPGSYDIRQSVWHVNVRASGPQSSSAFPATDSFVVRQCCNPEENGGSGWGVFNAVLGWTNSATYGSVISYNLYWLVVIIGLVAMRYNEVKGHWPLMKAKTPKATDRVMGPSPEKQSSSLASVNSEENVTTIPETTKATAVPV